MGQFASWKSEGLRSKRDGGYAPMLWHVSAFLGMPPGHAPKRSASPPWCEGKADDAVPAGGPDADLTQAAPTSVPPGDLKSIGAIRRGWEVDEFFCFGVRL